MNVFKKMFQSSFSPYSNYDSVFKTSRFFENIFNSHNIHRVGFKGNYLHTSFTKATKIVIWLMLICYIQRHFVYVYVLGHCAVTLIDAIKRWWLLVHSINKYQHDSQLPMEKLPLPIFFTVFPNSFHTNHARFSRHAKPRQFQFFCPFQNTLSFFFIINMVTIYPHASKYTRFRFIRFFFKFVQRNFGLC